MNSSIFALKTWLIILEIIQLMKYLLKKGLNTLIEIKNAEIIKNKKSTPRQKELLDLFSNLLVTILTDKTLKSEVKKMKTKMKMIKMKMKMKNMMMMKQ